MERPLIITSKGKVRGVKKKNVHGIDFYAFHGIPYAAPPIGPLRFKDPQPVELWFGEKDAQAFGSQCAQYDFNRNDILGSEDCLYLNVYTKYMQIDTKTCKHEGGLRPVMVWIHGGVFLFGSGDDNIFGPDYLVEKNIILVTINYRLGILGFLNLDDESASGNQGLKDQVMALQWVQENIRNFGGDPDNVTIFGQNTGASSVHYLNLSPLAEGLFHKAILQSGVATCPWAFTTDSMLDSAVKISVALGNEVTEVTDTKKLIEYLQSIDVKKLVAESTIPFESWKNRFLDKNPFLPSVDSKSKNPFLEIPLEEAVKRGIRVPFIIGYTNNEGIILLRELTDKRYTEIDADPENLLMNPKMNNFLKRHNVSVAQIKEYFMDSKPISRENGALLAKLRSATDFLIHIHQVLEIQPAGKPKYLYKFDHYCKETAVVQALYKLDVGGTCHGEDIMYLFHAKMVPRDYGLQLPGSHPRESNIRRRFLDLWSSFATSGVPNTLKPNMISFVWPPVVNSTRYWCLKLSEDISVCEERNILQEIVDDIQKNESTYL